MADIPDGVVLTRDRDLSGGRASEIWVRRALFVLLPLIVVLALVNVFGQRPSTSTETASAATLKLYSPARVRGGLLYQARFNITARRDLKNAKLELGSGWLENMTVNSVEPQPVSEASSDGRLSLELGHIPAGESYLLFLYFQVNPTNVGHRSTPVTLLDGDDELLTVDRSITIFP
jgi:hypothetical protein